MRNRTWIVAGAVVAPLMLASCDKEGGEVSVSGIEPRQGALQGDQPVRITGTNFRTDLGYTVYFGNKKAASVTILDPETLVAATPRVEAEGDVDVMIAADNGPAFRIKRGYRFIRPATAGAGEPAKTNKQQF